MIEWLICSDEMCYLRLLHEPGHGWDDGWAARETLTVAQSGPIAVPHALMHWFQRLEIIDDSGNFVFVDGPFGNLALIAASRFGMMGGLACSTSPTMMI